MSRDPSFGHSDVLRIEFDSDKPTTEFAGDDSRGACAEERIEDKARSEAYTAPTLGVTVGKIVGGGAFLDAGLLAGRKLRRSPGEPVPSVDSLGRILL